MPSNPALNTAQGILLSTQDTKRHTKARCLAIGPHKPLPKAGSDFNNLKKVFEVEILEILRKTKQYTGHINLFCVFCTFQ